jgi:hypothetical protein
MRVLEQDSQLQVEIHANGGWWKDSNGGSGQVSGSAARKAPMAVVASVANRFGMDGWELTEVISLRHGIYHLSFELVYDMEDEDDEQTAPT